MASRSEVVVIDCDGVDGDRAVHREDVVRCLRAAGRLEPLVGAVLGDVPARPLGWSVEELGAGAAGNPTTGGLFRVAGTSTGGDGDRAWSLVLKVLRSPKESGESWDDPADMLYWRREMNLVETGLLDTVQGLAAPRCHATSYISPDMCWLWLEDMGSFDRGRWTTAQYRMAPRALARFHAPYLAGTPIPHYSWLNRAFLRDFQAYCEPLFGGLFAAVESAQGGVLARLDPSSSSSELTPLMRILAHPEPWLALADRLPRALCHQDAHIDNLTWRSGSGDAPDVVAIDWQMLGPASVGSDLGQLLCELPAMLAGRSRVAVVESVLRAYHDELCALGVRVEWEEIRVAFAVDTVLRQGMWKLYLLCEELDGAAKDEDGARDASVGAFLREIGDGPLPALAGQLVERFR